MRSSSKMATGSACWSRCRGDGVWQTPQPSSFTALRVVPAPVHRPLRPAAGATGRPRGPDEPPRGGCWVWTGPEYLSRRPQRRPALRDRLGVASSPGSPIALAGFSLGASLALKVAAEAADRPVNGLDCVLAANPPIDLLACAEAMRRPENRLYHWNFVRWLRAEVTRLHRVFPELGPPGLQQVRSVYEFDDRYTAPRNGFASALDYYTRSSALPLIPRIGLPGLVVHAADDPFVPAAPFHKVRFPANLSLELVRQGGHLGYISRVPWQGDRRWLETRMAVWLAGRWRISTVNLDIASSSAIGRGPTWELATAMRDLPLNKYRAAMDVLQRGHDLLVEGLAEEVLDQQECLLEGGFQLHEFLESQGERLHFLGLIMGHLEQSAEALEEEAMRRHQRSAPKADPTHSRKRSRNRNSRAPKPRRQPPPNSEEAVDDIPF